MTSTLTELTDLNILLVSSLLNVITRVSCNFHLVTNILRVSIIKSYILIISLSLYSLRGTLNGVGEVAHSINCLFWKICWNPVKIQTQQYVPAFLVHRIPRVCWSSSTTIPRNFEFNERPRLRR